MELPITAQPKLFIGLDIHKKSWSVHFRSDVCEHRTLTFPPVNEKLLHYVDSNFPGHEVSMVYEAGCCGFHASRFFLSAGWKVTVVNPLDVPKMDKQNYQKTDRIDCRNLAKQLQAAQLNSIHIPSREQDELKSLLRQRAEMTKQLRNIKTQIKSLLLYHGIVIPELYDNPNWSIAFISWLQHIKWEFDPGKLCLDSKLRIYRAVKSEYLQVANELRAWCRKHHSRDYALLKSIPGVGGYLAAAVLAELGDIRRFSNQSQFASYVGIIPTVRGSGDKLRIEGVTPRCRSLLRSYLIEAAWVALRHDPQLQLYYRKHFGKNPKSIIVKIAHKLLNRMLSVIKNQKPYQCNYQKQEKETSS